MHSANWQSLGWLYTRIGSTTFGGGDPTMAALQSEIFARKWVDREQYGLVYALARATPGTNILAFCAGTGWLALGALGSILGVVGASFASAIIVTFLTAGYVVWRENPWAMSAINGMLAAATGLMGVAAWSLLQPQFRPGKWVRALVIFSAALLLTLQFGLTPIQVLGLAALSGALWPAPASKEATREAVRS
jgi:chromate transporter